MLKVNNLRRSNHSFKLKSNTFFNFSFSLLAEIQRYKSEIVNTKKLLDEKSKQFEDTSEQLECTKSTVKNLEKDIHQMTEQEQQLRKNIEEQTIENANKEEQNIKLNSMNDDLKNVRFINVSNIILKIHFLANCKFTRAITKYRNGTQ